LALLTNYLTGQHVTKCPKDDVIPVETRCLVIPLSIMPIDFHFNYNTLLFYNITFSQRDVYGSI